MLIAGAALMGYDEPVGSYLMASAAGLWVTANAVEAVIKARVMDLNDAVLEQREVMDRWQSMRRGRPW